ncbi:MAG: alpha/beta fold hydrolase [Candidatus Dormibacteraceae bacterium]
MRAGGAFAVETDAGRIAGSASGQGRDLLFLHGGPGLSDYADLLRDETKAWHTVHYQQRGIAPSATTGPFTVARHVDDAIAVLDGLGIERVVVLGHSWGGHLALQVAIAEPERVTGIVVVDGLGSTGDGGAPALGAELVRRLPAERAARWQALAQQSEQPGGDDEEALESLRLLWPGYFADPSSAPAMPASMRISRACNEESSASAIEAMAGGAFAERLRTLALPAIVMVGEGSPMPHAVGEETASLLPRAELVRVPAAGHLVWIEQPGSVARALARVADLAAA